MRLKHIKNADVIVSNSKHTVNNPKEYKGKWKELFGNDNDIEIEIGTGKGNFIIGKATANPGINYIGIEKYDSPLVSVVKKLEEVYIPNLKIVCFDAMNIEEIFDKEVDKIYLNFSDPWPKKRHAKRRLTSPNFLSKYDNIFKKNKVIQMKTDNDDLFEYSKEMFLEHGYQIEEENTNYFDTFRTEYEEKFIGLGKNINYIRVVKE